MLKITEKQFTRQVLLLAKLTGWRCAHWRPARTVHGWRTPCEADAKGFPDLLLLRRGKAIAAEIKVGRHKPTDEQQAWLQAFRDAGIEAYVWTPNDWKTIEEVLDAGRD